MTHNENLEPSFVGLFYVVDGELYWTGETVRKAKSEGGLKTYRKSHYEYWVETLNVFRPELKHLDCYHFPRGRVVFNEERRKYELLADQCVLQDEPLLNKVISAMNLPRAALEIRSDPHYRCSQCRLVAGRPKNTE